MFALGYGGEGHMGCIVIIRLVVECDVIIDGRWLVFTLEIICSHIVWITLGRWDVLYLWSRDLMVKNIRFWSIGDPVYFILIVEVHQRFGCYCYMIGWHWMKVYIIIRWFKTWKKRPFISNLIFRDRLPIIF